MITININDENENKLIPIKFPSKGGGVSELLVAMREAGVVFPKKFLLIKEDDEEIKFDQNILRNVIKKSIENSLKNSFALQKEKILILGDNDTIILKDITYLENYALNFFDIEDVNNLIKIKVKLDNNIIPEWRIVFPGINLWGECNNNKCEAFSSPVAYFVESKEFNLTNNKFIRCPMCNKEIECLNISFFNCYYNYYGKKINKNNKDLKIEEFGKRIENFNNIDIPNDNIININNEKYEIKKTEIGECDYYFDYNDSNIQFLEIIFQVREFK